MRGKVVMKDLEYEIILALLPKATYLLDIIVET